LSGQSVICNYPDAVDYDRNIVHSIQYVKHTGYNHTLNSHIVNFSNSQPKLYHFQIIITCTEQLPSNNCVQTAIGCW